MQLKNKHIVVGVTGSIAAFKIPFLVRMLVREGAEVKVMMTPAATDFVTPLTLSTLSGNPVLIQPFNPEDGTWNSHVELGRWADLYLLAPLSANTMAKMAQGIADNFFLAAYLSAKCPVFFAPAMDLDMYAHPATQKNVQTLVSFGNKLIEPSVGELASGLVGAGRMEEPENILKVIIQHFEEKLDYKGKKVTVTAGPTFEPLDDVRFIGNRSSGLMGFALAQEFAERGAEVTLISGPVSLKTPNSVAQRINISTADELFLECKKTFNKSDIFVMAAAVADYKPLHRIAGKMKKVKKNLAIELEPTTDILEYLGTLKKKGKLLIGFALESDKEEENAKSKLERKNLDLIVLNSMKDKNAGFGTPTNKVTIFSSEGKKYAFGLKSKNEVAKDIVDVIKQYISKK